MTQKTFSITEGLLNGVLQYLNTKPHGEVRQLIDAIGAEVVPQQKPEPSPDAQAVADTAPPP